jgi:hypothetical protein
MGRIRRGTPAALLVVPFVLGVVLASCGRSG